jgi:hypothetical protein
VGGAGGLALVAGKLLAGSVDCLGRAPHRLAHAGGGPLELRAGGAGLGQRVAGGAVAGDRLDHATSAAGELVELAGDVAGQPVHALAQL